MGTSQFPCSSLKAWRSESRSSHVFFVHRRQGKPMESSASRRSGVRVLCAPRSALAYWVRWSRAHWLRVSFLGRWKCPFSAWKARSSSNRAFQFSVRLVEPTAAAVAAEAVLLRLDAGGSCCPSPPAVPASPSSAVAAMPASMAATAPAAASAMATASAIASTDTSSPSCGAGSGRIPGRGGMAASTCSTVSTAGAAAASASSSAPRRRFLAAAVVFFLGMVGWLGFLGGFAIQIFKSRIPEEGSPLIDLM
mmetsp:Transcript_38761/g.84224  ORF Transcript_38761/g.84224 Transcript_38761/m.84224 type:complete len:251 (-) Transcript_38761:11-763(-)